MEITRIEPFWNICIGFLSMSRLWKLKLQRKMFENILIELLGQILIHIIVALLKRWKNWYWQINTYTCGFLCFWTSFQVNDDAISIDTNAFENHRRRKLIENVEKIYVHFTFHSYWLNLVFIDDNNARVLQIIESSRENILSHK